MISLFLYKWRLCSQAVLSGLVIFGLVIGTASIAKGAPAFHIKTASFAMQDTLLHLDSTIEINLPTILTRQSIKDLRCH